MIKQEAIVVLSTELKLYPLRDPVDIKTKLYLETVEIKLRIKSYIAIKELEKQLQEEYDRWF